ncbi:MAG: hypothetical protein H7X95_01780, partial [Deltaproteobacteria bacterium]|nr:hypothetical protein [Deltaproteobacteria bacterium]
MLTNSRTGLTVVCAALGILSCTEKGQSLILVTATLHPTRVDEQTVADVEIAVSRERTKVSTKTFPWIKGATNKLGVYVPQNVSGEVLVTATGLPSGGGAPTARTTITVTVKPGEISGPHSLTLDVPGTDPGQDGGTDGSGTDGGVTGTGGTGVGTGGAGAAATGGTGAGTTGTGGILATGGTPGTGGGGAVGSGGAGTTGTGGAAGSAVSPWRGANMIDGDVMFDDWTPSVAVDASGNAVVVYRHGAQIRSSKYSATTGMWGALVSIDSRAGGQGYTPSIAVDKNGRWLAVWTQASASPFRGLWQSTSVDGATWTAPTAITTVDSYDPHLSMNRDGAAVVSFEASKGGSWVMNAAIRPSAAAAWSAPHELRPRESTSFESHAAMSGTGDAFVVWQDFDTASFNSVWLCRFANNAWQPPVLIDTTEVGQANTSNVAANTVGQAIVVWRQSTATLVEVWARTYS